MAVTSPDIVQLRHSSSGNGSGEDTGAGTPSKQTGSRSRPRRNYVARRLSSMERAAPASHGDDGDAKDDDVRAFLDKRVMSALQERFNAVTMVPYLLFPLYFILCGCWVEMGRREVAEVSREAVGSEHDWFESVGCLNIPAFPYMTALPPLPVLAVAAGALIHCPFSMLYHWRYATLVEPSKRVHHWSRRLDSAFMHLASAPIAYATSGSAIYFIVNAVFNLDCAYKQFEEAVLPQRNLRRIALSILLYILPVLANGHFALFFQFVLMFSACGWVRSFVLDLTPRQLSSFLIPCLLASLPLWKLFARYPVGGWSHGLFHVVLSFLPYLAIEAAMRLESSQIQISLARQCAM